MHKIKFFLRKIERKLTGKISLKTTEKRKGIVLFSYITSSFTLDKKSPSFNAHTNHWECYKMVKIFLEQGYDVDIIDWRNNKFIPRKKYSFLIDLGGNIERLSQKLNNNCKKIMHITGSHWLFANKAELERLENLKKRKGIVLLPQRNVKPNKGIENADLATILGNDFTINTYKYANKPIYSIPISTTKLFPSPKNKNFKKIKKNYLWLGGGGMVHKGLDLVLEVFAKLPDFSLTVCGPFKAEKDFVKIYHKELYETPNIKAFGFINTNSKEFTSIINNCVGLIYPSCSEGQAGSVIACMHAGLIPLISYQSGVDVKNFGIILKENTIEEIKNSIKKISAMPLQELKTKAMASWEYARKNHTREKFSKEYKKFISKILNI